MTAVADVCLQAISRTVNVYTRAVASLLVEDCGPEGFTAHLKIIVWPNYRKVRCVHRLQHTACQARPLQRQGPACLIYIARRAHRTLS